MRTRATVAAVAVGLVGLVGCAGSSPRLDVASVELRQGRSHWSLNAEIAATPAERQRGLMGRRVLNPSDGMLFLFPRPVRAGFWMKDTLIALDIAFISAGRVVATDSMTPCRADPCPITEPGLLYDQALELPAGALARVGITTGAEVVVSGRLPRAS